MAKKEFIYRGKTLDELKKLSLAELAELLPARQRRCIERGFDDDKKKLIAKIAVKDRVKTHIRDMMILPQFVEKTILVHNGKEFMQVMIQPEMIGMFLGEVILTRKRVAHNNPGVGASKSSSTAKK